MRTLSLVLAAALAAPALMVAIALGPVTIGILCAVGCGLLVIGVINLAAGVVVGVRAVERRLVRRS